MVRLDDPMTAAAPVYAPNARAAAVIVQLFDTVAVTLKFAVAVVATADVDAKPKARIAINGADNMLLRDLEWFMNTSMTWFKLD
jgi:hypothetical protein